MTTLTLVKLQHVQEVLVKSNNDLYYLENGKVVFTEKFHKERGHCCGNNCRHCPYTKPVTKGNKKLEKENNG